MNVIQCVIACLHYIGVHIKLYPLLTINKNTLLVVKHSVFRHLDMPYTVWNLCLVRKSEGKNEDEERKEKYMSWEEKWWKESVKVGCLNKCSNNCTKFVHINILTGPIPVVPEQDSTVWIPVRLDLCWGGGFKIKKYMCVWTVNIGEQEKVLSCL